MKATAERVLVNGRASRRIAATDRGFQFGDGLFETMALIDNRVRFLGRHLARLTESCKVLALAPPGKRILRREIDEISGDKRRAVIKLIVSRGEGGHGYNVAANEACTRVLMRRPWPALPDRWYRDGIDARVCRLRLAVNPALAGIKHLNRLEQILARAEWRDPRIVEGIMLDRDGKVIEATSANIFLADGGELLTPDLSGSGVAGVMRGVVMDTAADLDIPCRVAGFDLASLRSAPEVFLTNSIAGIVPVRKLGRVRYRDFSLAARLSRALAEQGLTICNGAAA